MNISIQPQNTPTLKRVLTTQKEATVQPSKKPKTDGWLSTKNYLLEKRQGLALQKLIIPHTETSSLAQEIKRDVELKLPPEIPTPDGFSFMDKTPSFYFFLEKN